MNSKPVWFIWQVPGQMWLYKETLSQYQQQQKQPLLSKKSPKHQNLLKPMGRQVTVPSEEPTTIVLLNEHNNKMIPNNI